MAQDYGKGMALICMNKIVAGLDIDDAIKEVEEDYGPDDIEREEMFQILRAAGYRKN